MDRFLITATAILLVSFFAKPAHADLIIGGELQWSGGEITVTLVSADAAYHNFLGLFGPLDDELDLLENHGDLGLTATISVARMGELGYAVGDVLMFGIEVYTGGGHDDPNGGPAIYLMGPASNNADNVIHAWLDTDNAPNEYIVMFEDLPGGGDWDYNDTVFSFTDGVRVPEPGTLLLLGMGLFGMAARRRMKAKA